MLVATGRKRRKPSVSRMEYEYTCDCGTVTWKERRKVNSGFIRSCGCISRKILLERNTVHNHAKRGAISREYETWAGMIQRCHNKNNPDYPAYGGRGIFVCDEWRKDYISFFNHIGPKPGKSFLIDRINNDKGYEPGNVRWATPKESAMNRRTTIRW